MVHSTPSGGGSRAGVTHAPSSVVTKDTEVEQHSIGAAVGGFFRKVFKGMFCCVALSYHRSTIYILRDLEVVYCSLECVRCYGVYPLVIVTVWENK